MQSPTLFQGLRFRLLFSYMMVMAAILSFFSLWIYFRFSHRLDQHSQQIDTKLETIAQLAAPYFTEVQSQGGRYFNQPQKFPWEKLLNSDQKSIEWFNDQGQIIASQGTLRLSFSPVMKMGFLTLKRKPFPIRTFTYPIFLSSSLRQGALPDGYIRISQSIEDLEMVQNELLWQLSNGILIALGFVGVGGFWLTRKAIQPIEQSYQHLKQFTADASHELRNPLTAIQASIEVMLNHPERIHPKDVKKLNAIASATQQMTHLTEDLLFLTRTHTPLSSNEPESLPVSLNEVLQDLVDLLEPLAEDKNISLEYKPLVSISVLGDKTQLTRLFSNLLHNGILYTPAEGKVILQLTRQNRLGLVTVEDTGIGIAPEHLPLIFERFWRADKARSRREGGAGLGLSIAQAIAHRHHGKITVSSQLGVGSCFKVFLPIHYGF